MVRPSQALLEIRTNAWVGWVSALIITTGVSTVHASLDSPVVSPKKTPRARAVMPILPVPVHNWPITVRRRSLLVNKSAADIRRNLNFDCVFFCETPSLCILHASFAQFCNFLAFSVVAMALHRSIAATANRAKYQKRYSSLSTGCGNSRGSTSNPPHIVSNERHKAQYIASN
jgi:hypothetical protein